MSEQRKKHSLRSGLYISVAIGLLLSSHFTLANAAPTYEAQVGDLPAYRADLGEGAERHFAKPINVAITPQSHGLWQTLSDGQLQWQLTVQSAGAVNLNFGFQHYQLPPGAELSIQGLDGTELGPFTAADNDAHGQLWTAPLTGDQALLQLTVPAEQLALTQLELSHINHGWISLERAASGQTDPGPSQRAASCNVDISCPVAADWQDAARSVAMITIGGNSLCSAVLLNNSANNLRPFLLTANHCGITGPTLFNPGNAATVVALWNFQASSCNGPRNGSRAQTQSGAIFRAARDNPDFTLVELDDDPLPIFNVLWAGYDASGAAPNDGAAIHHPDGDEKAIALFSGTARAARGRAVDSTVDVDVWSVNWHTGITEGGSSGAPLFDDEQRVYGQLTFGASSCATPTAEDSFGRLSVAWEGGGQDDNRLRNWLDPVNGGNNRVLHGRDRNGVFVPPNNSGGNNNSTGGNTTNDNGGGSSGGGGGGITVWCVILLLLLKQHRQQANKRAQRQSFC